MHSSIAMRRVHAPSTFPRGEAGMSSSSAVVARPLLRGHLRVHAIAQVATKKRRAREGNAAGDFYVDETCIDCDTCRWMAPSTFSRLGEGSVVHSQPEEIQERLQALQALLSCPTFSIHNKSMDKAELKAAHRSMPIPVPGVPGVFHCGWHSEKTFGGASYLVQRPADQGGNILVDSPRFNPVLVKQLEELGGVSVIFLSHRDDIGDHEKWAAHFSCPRIMHTLEMRAGSNLAQQIEVQLEGEGPWALDGCPLASDEYDASAHSDPSPKVSDTVLIYTPGHTRGSVSLLHVPTKTLFSGDHLAGGKEGQDLRIFLNYNWFSVPRQLESVAKLLEYDWLHVLPGHGRPKHLKDALHRLKAINSLLEQHGVKGSQ